MVSLSQPNWIFKVRGCRSRSNSTTGFFTYTFSFSMDVIIDSITKYTIENLDKSSFTSS